MANVRSAVQARSGAPTRLSDEEANNTLRTLITAQSKAFRAVIPSSLGMTPDRFARMTISAVKSTPGLIDCFRTERGQTSLLIAAMHAASVGLEPNTPTQDGWILPREINLNGVKVIEAQFMIGYRGLLKLMRRAGNVLTVDGYVVRENDEFEYHRGLETDHLFFRQLDGSPEERGPLKYTVARVRYRGGGAQFVVLDRWAVHKRRAMSPSFRAKNNSYSPWIQWEESMWLKSGLRALTPFVELAPEDARAINLDDRLPRFDPTVGALIDDEPPEGDGSLPALAVGNDEAGGGGESAPLDGEGTGPATGGEHAAGRTQPPPPPADEVGNPPGTPTAEELIELAIRKEVVPAGKGHGTNRANTIKAMNAALDTDYAHLSEALAKSPADAIRWRDMLVRLPDPEPGAF
jgi:recombination protein RecT